MEFQVVAKLVYCRNCGELESWHSAIDGQCPDSGEPHPESELEDVGDPFEYAERGLGMETAD